MTTTTACQHQPGCSCTRGSENSVCSPNPCRWCQRCRRASIATWSSSRLCGSTPSRAALPLKRMRRSDLMSWRVSISGVRSTVIIRQLDDVHSRPNLMQRTAMAAASLTACEYAHRSTAWQLLSSKRHHSCASDAPQRPTSFTCGCRDRLRVKTEEHPIMLAEPTFNPREARERTLEVHLIDRPHEHEPYPSMQISSF